MHTTVSRPAREAPDATGDHRHSGTGADRLLAAIRDLAPMIAARAGESERARRIPQDIIDVLRASGAFKMLVPRDQGGLGLGIPDIVPMLEIVSAADGSAGWVMMVSTVSQIFCTRLPRALYDRLFDGADPMVIGVGTPAGRAEKMAGGYRVSGRWPLASGCQSAQWIIGHCVVWDGGGPVMTDGTPVTRFVVLPTDRWHIEDTWRASGLAGSGSHHASLDHADVPDSQTCDLFHDPSCVPGPFEASVLPFLPVVHAAVAIGIASGASADLTAIASSGKRQLFAGADLRDSAIFQHEFGRAGADLRAAKALLDVQTAAIWRRALDGSLDANTDFIDALQAGGWIHTTCARFVDRCYGLAGTSVLTSPLERRLRDIHLTGQHIFGSARFYAKAGANHLGLPPTNPLSEI